MKTLLLVLALLQAPLARAQDAPYAALRLPLIDTTPPTKDWRLVVDQQGRIYRERKNHAILALVIAGAFSFAFPYVLGGAVSKQPVGFIPIAGAFLIGPIEHDSFGILGMGVRIGGIAQIVGVTLTIVGAVVGRKRAERQILAYY